MKRSKNLPRERFLYKLWYKIISYEKITIAIDGFSSCGKAQWPRTSPVKSAISISTAEPCTVPSLYIVWRTVSSQPRASIRKTEKADQQHPHILSAEPGNGTSDTYLNGINVEKKIRTMEVSSRVSPIAALDFVREAMVAQQQEMGKAKGIVMDGRDIGTTVFPDAELKIFVTASPEIRAQRRYDELKAKGEEAGFDEILENVKQRDYIDQNREVSPLRKADDALLLDNSHMTISQQKEWLAEQFEKVCKS